jgi:hypothetical protein
MNRPAIFDALYERIAAVEGIRTASKRMEPFSNVEPSRQPAALFEIGDQMATTEPGKLTRWALRFNVYVLAFDAGPNGPMPALLALADRIEAALQAQPGEQPRSGTATTLGGQVVAARIAGAVHFDVDTQQAGQGGFVIPVDVIAI